MRLPIVLDHHENMLSDEDYDRRIKRAQKITKAISWTFYILIFIWLIGSLVTLGSVRSLITFFYTAVTLYFAICLYKINKLVKPLDHHNGSKLLSNRCLLYTYLGVKLCECFIEITSIVVEFVHFDAASHVGSKEYCTA